MKSIRATLFTRNLGAVMAEATRGTTFVVTNHGRPLVVITPADMDMDLSDVEESTIGQKAPSPGEPAA